MAENESGPDRTLGKRAPYVTVLDGSASLDVAVVGGKGATSPDSWLRDSRFRPVSA